MAHSDAGAGTEPSVASVGLRSGSVMANMCLKCSSMIPSGKQKSTDGCSLYSGGQLTSFFGNVLKMHNVVFVGRVVRTHITMTHIKPTGATN